MPHFIVGNTLPRLGSKTVTGVIPLVSKAAGDIGPVSWMKILRYGDDAMTYT